MGRGTVGVGARDLAVGAVRGDGDAALAVVATTDADAAGEDATRQVVGRLRGGDLEVVERAGGVGGRAVSSVSVSASIWPRGTRENSLLVNNHDHAVLAVAALRAVEPHGPRVVDRDGEDGDGLGAGGNGHEAGVDAGHVGVQRDGLARVVEGRLRQRVVATPELELDRVAGSGHDLLREELLRRGAVDDTNLDGEGAGCVGLRVSIAASVVLLLLLPFLSRNPRTSASVTGEPRVVYVPEARLARAERANVV